MKIIIFLATYFLAASAVLFSDDGGNTDVAMEVDGKEIKTPKKLLYNMQDFLQQLIKASGKKHLKTRTQRKHTMYMNEFFQLLCNVFGNLDRRELEAITDTLESEIKKRRHADENYRRLMKIPIVKRSLEIVLQTIRDEPPVIWKYIAKKLNTNTETSAEAVNSDEFDRTRKNYMVWTEKLVLRAKKLFGKHNQPIPYAFKKIIDDLDDYSKSETKYKRQNKNKDSEQNSMQEDQSDVNAPPEKLVKLVKEAMKTFDHNTNLSGKNHKLITDSLQALWFGTNKYARAETKTVKTTSKRFKQDRRSTLKYMSKSTKPRSRITTGQSSLLNEDEESSYEKGSPNKILRNKKNEQAAQLSEELEGHGTTQNTETDPLPNFKDMTMGEEENTAEDSGGLENATTEKHFSNTKGTIKTAKESQKIQENNQKHDTESESESSADKSIDKEQKSRESQEEITTTTETSVATISIQETSLKLTQKRTAKEQNILGDFLDLLKIRKPKNVSEKYNSSKENMLTETEKSNEKGQSDFDFLEVKEEEILKEKDHFDVKPETGLESRLDKNSEEYYKNKEAYPEVEKEGAEKNINAETQGQSKEQRLKNKRKLVSKNKPKNANEINEDPNNKIATDKSQNSQRGSSDVDLTEQENNEDYRNEQSSSKEITKHSDLSETFHIAKKSIETTINYENEITASTHYDTTLNLPECSSNSKCNNTSKTITTNKHNPNSISSANVSDWSSESENLYKFFAKQSKNLPIKKILNNDDITFLKTLNITLGGDSQLLNSTGTTTSESAIKFTTKRL